MHQPISSCWREHGAKAQAGSARAYRRLANHSCLLRWKTHVWECEGGPTTTPTRASEARFILRSWDPVERLVRDAVLSEKEAQLGRMFLHVTHAVQLEF